MHYSVVDVAGWSSLMFNESLLPGNSTLSTRVPFRIVPFKYVKWNCLLYPHVVNRQPCQAVV